MTLDRERVREAARYFGRWVELQRSLQRVPGVQVALSFDGELLLSEAYGVAEQRSGSPLRPSSLFRVASISKTFTATAVLQLVERGLLRLDDALGKHVEVPPGISAVTVRELLSHGGGVIRDGVDGDVWQLHSAFPDAAGLIDLLGAKPDVYPRNEVFKYSNVGYGLLGLIVEAVTGRPYAEHVRQEVLDPIELRDTCTDLDGSRQGQYATGYSAAALDFPQLPIEPVGTAAMAPAAGFTSTAADLCRWAEAHFLGDERLLSDDAKRMMQRAEWAIPGGDAHYGLGWRVEQIGERRTLGHRGGFPGYGSDLTLDPKARLAVCAALNVMWASAQTLTRGAFRLVDFAAAVEPVSDPVPREELDRLCGRYANLWYVMDVVRFGDRLFSFWPGSADPTENAAELEVVGPGRLRQTLANGLASHGEHVTYELAEGGVQRVRGDGAMTMYPIEAYRSALAGRTRISVEGPRP